MLIAGRYVQTRHFAHGLLGSANQSIHPLAQRYAFETIRQVPHAEIRFATDVSVAVGGIAPPDLAADLGLNA